MPSAPPSSRRDSALNGSTLRKGVLAAGLVSLVLGLVRIGAKSVWLDEATSILFAQARFGAWWHTQIHHEVNSGLYYLLLRPWLGLAGATEAQVRLPSAIAAAAAAAALPLLGRRLVGIPAAVIAGLLLALAPESLHYSQEARAATHSSCCSRCSPDSPSSRP